MSIGPDSSVVTAGYAPLDIVSYQGRIWHAAGGSAGNVAAILGFLGWSSSLVTDLGDDVAGRQIQRDLAKSNVSTKLTRLVAGVTTPRLIHEISGAGHQYRFKCSQCGSRFPFSRPLRLDRAREVIEQSDHPTVFFLDRLNAGTVLLAEHYASEGSRVIFEPSRPARPDLTARILAVATVVKHASDRTSGLDEANARAGQVWIVTDGAAGAKYRVGRGAWHQSPAFSYPVIDAGGAGDWTTAGLAHALPKEGRLTVAAVGDALRWAQALAAVSCGAAGARGLSAQQSAQAVLRAAHFLEQRGESRDKVVDKHGKWVSPKPNEATCTCCLQPLAAADTARSA